MKKVGTKVWKFVAAGAVTFISFAACVSGTIAWFTMSTTARITSSSFAVTAISAEVKEVKVIKFDYDSITVGTEETFNYLLPETGKVNEYDFNVDEESFGYYDEEVPPVWHEIELMNRYDPVELVISQNNLMGLNTNVVYEVTLESPSLSLATMSLEALRLTTKTKLASEIFLTDCADFDVFFEDDLDDPSLSALKDDGTPVYMPDYTNKPRAALTPAESALEEKYYKFSYLAYQKATHSHFYVSSGSKPTEVMLQEDYDMEFVDNEFKVYVNVNYAPSELEQYSREIALREIKAVYDYAFSFTFSQRESS